MKSLKIITDANCHRKSFYKGKSTGAALFIDGITGEQVQVEEFVLGELTPYAAEYQTVLLALDIASGITRGKVEVWTDAEYVVRHMAGDYLLKSDAAKDFFDKAKQLELRFKEVRYIHHDRSTEKAKSAHVAAAEVYIKNHT